VNLHIGDWCFDPEAATVVRDGTSARLGPRGVAVLAYLSRRANEIVSNSELLAVISGDDAPATVNALHKCITDLRHALGDEADQPQYIETVPRRGYRLVARVTAETQPKIASRQTRYRSRAVAGLLGVLLAIGGYALGFKMHDAPSVSPAAKPAEAQVAAPAKSLAILRFGAGNNPEDQRVAEAISSKIFERIDFWHFVKLAPRDDAYSHSLARESVASIGKVFGVAYVLDGALQRRGEQLHASIRIIHADDGVVVYAREDDVPNATKVDVQGQIVTDVLRAFALMVNPGWQDMQQSGSKSIDAYLALSDAGKASSDNDLDGALAYAREAIRLDPSYLQAYEDLADVLAEKSARVAVPERGSALNEISDLATRVARFAPNSIELREILVDESEVADAPLRDREAQLRSYIKATPHDDETGVWYGMYADLLLSARLFDLAERYAKANERKSNFLWTVRHVRIAAATETTDAASSLIQTALRALPNNVELVTMAIPQLARAGHWDEADRRLEEVEKIDKGGRWSYAAAIELRVMRGEFNDKPTELRKALDDPRSTDLLRGIVAFMRADVNAGVEYWRSAAAESKLLEWASVPLLETLFPDAVKSDARYLALLDELDVGKDWTAYMRQAAEDLAPATDIWPEPQA